MEALITTKKNILNFPKNPLLNIRYVIQLLKNIERKLMLDKYLTDYLLKLFEDEIEEFIEENSDIEYDKDEVIDITSGLTGCEGCNSNSVWGFVRGIERAKDIIRKERV